MRPPLLLGATLVATSLACASAPDAGSRLAAPARAVLTRSEIVAAAASGSAYQAVQRLRPEFLALRGATSLHNAPRYGVAVYIDDVLLGSTRALADIPAASVEEIRYVPAWDAQTRYGSGHQSGVLAVRTKH